jgi:hypothetical protein
VDKILKGAKPADLNRAAKEVRAGDQSQGGEADRIDNTSEHIGKSRSGDSMNGSAPLSLMR